MSNVYSRSAWGWSSPIANIHWKRVDNTEARKKDRLLAKQVHYDLAKLKIAMKGKRVLQCL